MPDRDSLRELLPGLRLAADRLTAKINNSPPSPYRDGIIDSREEIILLIGGLRNILQKP